jgi:hypothetical protein
MKTEWLVVVWYDYADKKRGDIISRHRTYELASRKAKRFPAFWGIKNVND